MTLNVLLLKLTGNSSPGCRVELNTNKLFANLKSLKIIKFTPPLPTHTPVHPRLKK